MKNTKFDIKEMFNMGLGINEINQLIGDVYEELATEEANKVRAAEDRLMTLRVIADKIYWDRYVAEDLETLRQHLKPTATWGPSKIKPKKADAKEIEEWFRALNGHDFNF